MNKTKLLVITGLSCADRELLSPLEQAGLAVETVLENASGLSGRMFPGDRVDAVPARTPPLPAGLPAEVINEHIRDYLGERPATAILAWADTRAQQLLSQWDEPDPELRFLLVYQPPWLALGRLLQDKRAFGADPALAPEYWLRYNRALVRYYTRHRSNCLLLNTAYRENIRTGLISAINSHFGLELRNTVSPAAAIPDPDVAAAGVHAFLLGQIAPNCIELYLELESCADLLGRQPDFDCQRLLLSPPEAPVFFGTWADRLQAEQASAERTAKLEDSLAAAETENGMLRQQLSGLRQDAEQLRIKWDSLRLAMEKKLKQLHDLESAHAELSKMHKETQARLAEAGQEAERRNKEMQDKLAEQESESELLLLQLHQVQEELEHYFLDNQKLDSGRTELQTQLEHSRQLLGEHTRKLEQSSQNLREKDLLLERSNSGLHEMEQRLAQMQHIHAETLVLLDEYREALRKARYSISTLYRNRRIAPEQTLM